MAGENGAAGAERDLSLAMRATRPIVLYAFLLGGAVALLYLAPSLFMMQVYDRVLVSGSLTTLWLLGFILAFALLTLSVLDMVRVRLLQRASLRLDRIVTPVLLTAALRRSGREGGASQAQSVLREFDGLRQTLAGPAALAILDVPWAPLYLAVCFLIHPWLGVLVIVGGAILLLIAFLNERALRRDIADLSARAPKYYAAQESELGAAGAIRALGMQGAFLRRQMLARGALSDVQSEAAFRGAAYSGATKFWRLILQSAALGLGAYLAVKGEISPGALIAGSILTSRALQPIEQIVGAWRPLMLAGAAYNKLAKILDAEPPAKTPMALPVPRGEIRMERASVRVPNSERWALFDVSFTIPAGQMVAVIGPSGAGKSTFARLVSGAIEPDVGIVRLDMANMRDWDPDALGVHVGYMPQELSLLPGTIADNICRFSRDTGSKAAVEAAIVTAAKEAGAHDLILRLPLGYDTALDIGGAGLSAGQAQRIALARALYGSPALIVLDEPNAHLDSDGEFALMNAMRNAKARGATIFLVAHRLHIFADADQMMVLRDGRVEHVGERDEILRRLQGGAAPAAGQRAELPLRSSVAARSEGPAFSGATPNATVVAADGPTSNVATLPRRPGPGPSTPQPFSPMAPAVLPPDNAANAEQAAALESKPQRYRDLIKPELTIGLAAAGVFFGVVVGWGAFAPLDAAIVAQGEIAVAGDRQVVQHRDGGIVHAIYVTEGQRVAQGQVLVDLVAAETLAQEQAAASQMFDLQLQRAQLIAEGAGRLNITRPEEWAKLEGPDRALADAAFARHQAEMRARGASARALAIAPSELDARITGARQQIAAIDRQKVLLAEELAGMEKLAEKNLVPLSRIRSLQRGMAELDGQRGQLTAQIAQLRDDRAQRQREVEASIAQLAPRLQGLQDQLERTRLRAPVAGVVVGLAAHTAGGVIAPGAKVMEIVPDSPRLLIAAQVAPQDADDLIPGMKTEVKITALTGRNLPIVHGIVRKVSADRLVDDRSGRSYFRAEVEVPEAELRRLVAIEHGRGRTLRPGLPAEVVIPTRKRTALQYLIEPLTQTFWQSFRER